MIIATKMHFHNSSSSILTPCLPVGHRILLKCSPLTPRTLRWCREEAPLFAEYLCINFYGKEKFPGQLTSRQEAQLRKDFLSLDRHHCVISCMFDILTSLKKFRQNGYAEDDDGKWPFCEDCTDVVVAHIIPSSMIEFKDNESVSATFPGVYTDSHEHCWLYLQSQSHKFVISILYMFDAGISLSLHESEIDKPRNLICMASEYRYYFDEFGIFFREVDWHPHTYEVYAHDEVVSDFLELPLHVDFNLLRHKPIDPPCPRLLRIHYIISHVLHLSRAGKYLGKMMEAMDEPVQADGSSELGSMLSMKLSNWAGVLPVCAWRIDIQGSPLLLLLLFSDLPSC